MATEARAGYDRGLISRATSGLRRIGRARRGRGARPAGSEPPDRRKLFFLVGRAKSGTSWLMNILDCHPEVVCRGEGRFFGREHRLGAERSRSLHRALADSEQLRAWTRGSVWARGESPERLAGELTAAIARELMLADPAAANARAVGDKTPLNGPGVVAEIAELCPGSAIVQIVRDGRDVCVSSVHHVWNQAERGRPGSPPPNDEVIAIRDAYRADPEAHLAAGRSLFAGGQLDALARDWAEVTAAASTEGRALSGDRYLEVRYERLLGAGVEELAGVCELLAVEAAEPVLRNCLERNSFERLSAGRRAGSEDSTAFLRIGIAGDWRRVFNDADRETFKRAAGRTLVELGYEPDQDW